MKPSIVVSILVSLVFIGGALVSRLSTGKNDVALVPVEEANTADYTKDLAEIQAQYNLRNNSATSSSGPSAPLTADDVLARRMFSEFSELSKNGLATESNLNVLAEKYANEMAQPSLESVTTLSLNQIRVVPDTDESFKNYSASLEEIYGSARSQILSKINNGVGSPGEQKFSSLMLEIAALYEQVANEVKFISVPTTLAQTHLDLINNFYKSAVSGRGLAKITENPISAYATIDTDTKNSKEEAQLLESIQSKLLEYGISFSYL